MKLLQRGKKIGMSKGKILVKVVNVIITFILIVIIIKLYGIYVQNNFNSYTKSEAKLYTSEFKRDSKVKYSKTNSYKISSRESNDALFYRTVQVEKNRPYKVTCMVKTENVITKDEASNAGANICIVDTVEKSKSIRGTTDWQKLEFIFNSKDRTSVDIAFRLGAFDDECTGTVWFSDMQIESGTQNTSTDWNFVCFVFKNTDVIINNKNIKLTMTNEDITSMKENMERFKNSCKILSNNQMSVRYDFIVIDEPIKSLSYDEKNGYFVSGKDVSKMIDSYLEKYNYDHIFVAIRLGDANHINDIQVNDWIGLGGTEYLGIGFSNIRLPNSDKSYIYKYNERINTFPEEVFIHEFCHTLERNSEEWGYETPALHDNEKYGYKNQSLEGLKAWYGVYMTKSINNAGKKIGIDSKVYTTKPNKNDDFKYSYKMDSLDEPENIIEEIKIIINKIPKMKEIREEA